MIRNDADVRFDPVIAQLGPFQLGWHGIFTAIAVLVAVWRAGRLALQRGFVVQAKRWAVERAFGWLNRARRLAKDFEECLESSVAWIYLAFCRLLLRRLASA